MRDAEISELLKNCEIVHRKYKNVIGILYNGNDIVVYKDGKRLSNEIDLRNKEYYLGLYRPNRINKNEIYSETKKINDLLKFSMRIRKLSDRMIFTACTLVAKRYGAEIDVAGDCGVLKTIVTSTLDKEMDSDLQVNRKLKYLIDTFQQVEIGSPNDKDALKDFIDSVNKISIYINSDYWNGEDVMGIFFNEFNRYKTKSENGQVFTPDHITSLMCRIVEVSPDDRVLDAACGSGAFLVKAMCNMINAAGGMATTKAKEIRKNQLFGIEYDRSIYALACANMLIHKDGKTNIAFLDSRTKDAFDWIKKQNITKVLMNPPFERKYGCLDIVLNVLDAVSQPSEDGQPLRHVECAFILPDDKLEKNKSKAKMILARHSIEKIIKLPTKVFSNGIKTSIYIFKTGIPHFSRERSDILGYYIADDGLETVKNQGRHDIYNKWQEIEDYWVDVIHHSEQDKENTKKWINPKIELRYNLPESPFQIDATDFKRAVLEYALFQCQIDATDFKIIIQNVDKNIQ